MVQISQRAYRIPIDTIGKYNILCLPEIHPAKAVSAIYHVP